jgi:hypothetical protein
MSGKGENGNSGHGGGNEGRGPGGGDEGKGHQGPVEVVVNEKAVVLDNDDQTGLSIKQAAIAQGVAIQLDFVLSIERGQGKTELVGDNQHIKVHKHERFLAIPNDDNS